MSLDFLFKARKHNKRLELEKLVYVLLNNPDISDTIIQLLQLDSYRRRNVLNRWLERLRRADASKELMQPLSCLFDDDIAERALKLLSTNKGELL